MTRNAAQHGLTQADVDALLQTASRAWNRTRHVRHVRFLWRGKRYVARHTGLRLLVDTAGGLPVACRWG
jgi:hypothetical protein